MVMYSKICGIWQEISEIPGQSKMETRRKTHWKRIQETSITNNERSSMLQIESSELVKELEKNDTVPARNWNFQKEFGKRHTEKRFK